MNEMDILKEVFAIIKDGGLPALVVASVYAAWRFGGDRHREAPEDKFAKALDDLSSRFDARIDKLREDLTDKLDEMKDDTTDRLARAETNIKNQHSRLSRLEPRGQG